MSEPIVHGPEVIHLEGRPGSRYWVHHPFSITGDSAVDEALSSYPLAVFRPEGRDPAHTPVVIALQGIAAPFQWNSFLVPTLLDMGIACALFDTPLAGERSLIRHAPGDVFQQVQALVEHRVRLTTSMVGLAMDMVARDLTTVAALLRERHGMGNDRLALFGVSMGCLFASLAFMRDGFGKRLLGVIGHADLHSFARSYSPVATAVLASPFVRWIANPLSWAWSPAIAARDFVVILRDLCRGQGSSLGMDPMNFVERVESPRRARFLLGRHDSLVRVEDGYQCAGRFPDGEGYAVDGLAHGTTIHGPSFVEHVRYFLDTQLSDWR
jgi:alpha-beta hydrolase superfamily lysophospholipase